MKPRRNIRKLYQEAHQASQEQRVGNVLYEDMKKAWDRYFEAADQLMRRFPAKTTVAYAYLHGEAEWPEKTEHIILGEDFNWREIHRSIGDALCRPAREFGSMESVDLGRPANCVDCLVIVEKWVKEHSQGLKKN